MAHQPNPLPTDPAQPRQQRRRPSISAALHRHAQRRAITHHNVTQLLTHYTPTCPRQECGHTPTRWPSTSRSRKSSVRCSVEGGWVMSCPIRHSLTPDLHALISAEHVTVLSQSVGAGRCRRRARVDGDMIGAEPCPAELVNRWAPGRANVNVYGPTEATVDASISAPLTAGQVCASDSRAVVGGGVFCVGWLAAAGAGRCRRRALHRRSRCGPGISGPGRTDRITIFVACPFGAPGAACSSHRRPGALGR